MVLSPERVVTAPPATESASGREAGRTPAAWVSGAVPRAGSMASLGASLPSFILTFALAGGLAIAGRRSRIRLTGRAAGGL